MNPPERDHFQPAAPASETVLTAGSVPAPAFGCWSDIGVSGNGTCPELPRFVHCRNCPVYSRVGLQLLEQPLPPGYRQEWTEHFAKEKWLRELSSTSVVLFRLSTEWLALPTRCLQEIADRRTIHSLPNQPQLVLGLANVRGELLLCISLSHLVGLGLLPSPQALRSNYHRLLVMTWDQTRVCFPANEVQGPRRYRPGDLKAPPAALAKRSSAYTHSVLKYEHRTIALLDPEALGAELTRRLK